MRRTQRDKRLSALVRHSLTHVQMKGEKKETDEQTTHTHTQNEEEKKNVTNVIRQTIPLNSPAVVIFTENPALRVFFFIFQLFFLFLSSFSNLDNPFFLSFFSIDFFSLSHSHREEARTTTQGADDDKLLQYKWTVRTPSAGGH